MSTVKSIYELVRAWALETPKAVAIAVPGRFPLTYGSLLRQIEQTARALNGMGLGRNARIAVALPNGPEAAVSFLSVAACATCAPLYSALTARVSYCCPPQLPKLLDLRRRGQYLVFKVRPLHYQSGELPVGAAS